MESPSEIGRSGRRFDVYPDVRVTNGVRVVPQPRYLSRNVGHQPSSLRSVKRRPHRAGDTLAEALAFETERLQWPR